MLIKNIHLNSVGDSSVCYIHFWLAQSYYRSLVSGIKNVPRFEDALDWRISFRSQAYLYVTLANKIYIRYSFTFIYL